MPNISEEELAELRRAAEGREAASADQEQILREIKTELAGVKAAVEPANPYYERYGLTAWGKKFINHEFDVECPSGQRARVRSLKIEDAFSLGLLDSLDIFTSMLMKPILDEEEPGAAQSDDDGAGIDSPALSVLEGLKDPEKRAKFFGTVNKVLAHCVIIPKVVLVDDGNLSDSEVFADDIPFNDKMFIFQAVFGSRASSLNSFREGSADGVAALEEEPSIPNTPE